MNLRLERLLSPTVITVLSLMLVTALGSISPFREVLAYDQLSTQQGQFWRPLTAWIAQLNLRHWLLNQWGLLLMLMLLPTKLSRPRVLAFAGIWLLASLLLWRSDYGNYVGLSGLLYGWLVWAAYCTPYYGLAVRLTFIIILVVKVFSENGYIELPQSDWVGEFIGGQVAHESHLWGLLGGLLMIAIWQIARLFRLVREHRG